MLTVAMLIFVILSDIFYAVCSAEKHYAECQSKCKSKWYYAEYCNTDCHLNECRV